MRKQDVLRDVAWARAFNIDQQTDLLNGAAELMSTSKFGLIIVDSATAVSEFHFL